MLHNSIALVAQTRLQESTRRHVATITKVLARRFAADVHGFWRRGVSHAKVHIRAVRSLAPALHGIEELAHFESKAIVKSEARALLFGRTVVLRSVEGFGALLGPQRGGGRRPAAELWAVGTGLTFTCGLGAGLLMLLLHPSMGAVAEGALFNLGLVAGSIGSDAPRLTWLCGPLLGHEVLLLVNRARGRVALTSDLDLALLCKLGTCDESVTLGSVHREDVTLVLHPLTCGFGGLCQATTTRATTLATGIAQVRVSPLAALEAPAARGPWSGGSWASRGGDRGGRNAS